MDDVRNHFPEKVAEILNELGGVSAVPPVTINTNEWNADRLNSYLQDIDARISTGKYEGAITLACTCLEGFLKAFINKNIPNYSGPEELIRLSRAAQSYLRDNIQSYPDEALNMLNHIGHTVDRARNRFSESHFDEEANRWLAVFIRDLVNSEIRLLLHFI